MGISCLYHPQTSPDLFSIYWWVTFLKKVCKIVISGIVLSFKLSFLMPLLGKPGCRQLRKTACKCKKFGKAWTNCKLGTLEPITDSLDKPIVIYGDFTFGIFNYLAVSLECMRPITNKHAAMLYWKLFGKYESLIGILKSENLCPQTLHQYSRPYLYQWRMSSFKVCGNCT